MNNFITKENTMRRSKYLKRSSDEDFIKSLNTNLLALEEQVSDSSETSIPNLYIFGLPRSGTTLVTQILCHLLDAAWVTNLMARFWETPVVGMRLSKILDLFCLPLDFQSEFGVTKGAHQPHEFGYFWMKQLNYDDVVIMPKEHESKIDWIKLKQKLNAITHEAGKTVIYKNMLYAFHLDTFLKYQPNAIIIYCKRNLPDIACSVLRAREARYGDKNVWWSIKPPGYKDYMSEDCYTQIAYQLKWFNSYFEEKIAALSQYNIFEVQYEQLSKDIKKIINTLARFQKRNMAPETTPKTYRNKKEYKIFKELLLK